MPITVIIPTLLGSLTNQQQHVAIAGVKVSEVIERMERQYPSIRAKLIFDGRRIVLSLSMSTITTSACVTAWQPACRMAIS